MHKLALLALMVGLPLSYQAGRMTSSNRSSSWLPQKMIECKCITELDWILHDFQLDGDAYISSPHYSIIANEAVHIGATVSEALLGLPSRDLIRDRLMSRLRRDSRPLPSITQTKLSQDEIMNKYVWANWSTPGGNSYAYFSDGQFHFSDEKK